jgi:hypothetical protein
MASVFKPAGAKKYVILFTDATGRRRKKTGATDKTVTERIARDIENRVALRREGVIYARTDALASHEARRWLLISMTLARPSLPRAIRRNTLNFSWPEPGVSWKPPDYGV